MDRQNIFFISQIQKRGGAIYEELVKQILEKDEKINLDVLELDATKNNLLLFNKLKYYYQIKSYKSPERYDVVITNKAGVYTGVLNINSKKKALILHHYISDENQYPFIRKFLKEKLLSNLNKFDSIIVVSQYWKNFFSNYVSADKLHIIYNSFDVNKILSIKEKFCEKEFKSKYNIPSEKIIVYAGNALKIKGYEEVVSQLNDKEYFIITSGNKDKNADVKNLHLTLNYTEYIHLLCCANVTVILSKFQEGWNRIGHESLICGTPVIGTNAAGMGELLQSAKQIIWKEGDDLQQMVKSAYNNEELINNGRNYANQYDLEYFKNRWNSILKESLT